MKKHILLMMLLALCLCPALAWGEGFGLWEEIQLPEGSDVGIPEVNYKRSILDARGREIRVQQGLGLTERDVTLKWDTSYRYEETAQGLVIHLEETQFELDGTVSRYVKQTLLDGQALDTRWFTPEGKLILHSVQDPDTGIQHRLLLRRNLDGGEGDITISEAELPKEGPASREVLYHFKADGSFDKAEHYVKKFLASTFSLEPYEGQPTEAVLKMAADWFAN